MPKAQTIIMHSAQNSIDPEKILRPEIVKNNLILAALYLTAYELLKESICGRIRTFFSDPAKTAEDWDFLPTADYKREITDVDKDLINASCLWLKKMNVVTEDDIKSIEAIRKHRNEIAHELPKLLVNKKMEVNVDKFLKIRELLIKIERWWIIEFELAIDEDYAGVDVNPDKVFSGPMILLGQLISVVTKDCKQESETCQ